MSPVQGIKFTTAGTVPNPGPWKAGADAAWPTQGMLYDFDLAHSANAQSTLPAIGGGIPATNTLIPNLVWQQAAALIGSGTETTLAGSLSYAGITTAGNTKGKIERTSKGGIHVILSQAVDLSNGNGVAITIAQESPIDLYLQANRSAQFYFELWDKTTRLALAVNVWKTDIGGGTTNPTYIYASISQAAVIGPGATTPLGKTLPVQNLLPQRASVAGASGGAIINNTTYVAPWVMGCPGAYNSINLVSQGFNQKWPSAVWYRSACEVLSVSGRTFAQANAAWDFAYQSAFGPGGRYYGDTVTTAPSSIA